MSDLKVRCWTGAFGLAVVVLLSIEFPLRVALGVLPPLEEAARYADYVTRTNSIMLSIIVIDMFMMACILIFLVGFHHLIRQARSEYEWVGTLIFGRVKLRERVAVEHTLAHIGYWQGRCARYRGIRKKPL